MQASSVIDLRSDTVTRPTPAMREAMARAAVGDDVYGEDPSVNALEARTAERLGKAAALFLPSGTQSNLAALLAHCQRGDEYIAAADAHLYRNEGGGGAVLGGIQPQPVAVDADGAPDLGAVAAAIKPDDAHHPRTRLLCLENTHSGTPLTLAYQAAAAELARSKGLALHLDGARLFNAATALGVPAPELCAPFDSVSACLSKGLGAPVGTVLAGSESFVHAARRWRKVLGGGMRQAGVLAAAGLHALEHHVERLGEDHRRAAALADALATQPAFADAPPRLATNMVFLTQPAAWLEGLARHLAERDIRIRPSGRVVVHLDVDDDAIDRVIDAVGAYRG